MEPRQWKHCEYCGSVMVIDGSCENCEIENDDRLIPEDLDDTEMNRLAHELLYPEDFEPKRRDDEWWLMTDEEDDND